MYEKEEPWFKIYNKLNIPKEINIDDNENLLTFLKTQFEKFRDLPMYENMNKIFTFGEVDKISKSIANFLMEKFDKGDAIAVHMPNIIQMPVAIISILRAEFFATVRTRRSSGRITSFSSTYSLITRINSSP